MKNVIVMLTILSFALVSNVPAQTSDNRYEAEILMNPNSGKKDTREVNAVLVFEKDSLKIYSRRKKDQIFKEFKYSEIEFAEHSSSKNPFFVSNKNTFLLTLVTGLPVIMSGKEKHWLTIGSKEDFAVLKIETDNFRMIKMEFFIRKIQVDDVNEDRL